MIRRWCVRAIVKGGTDMKKMTRGQKLGKGLIAIALDLQSAIKDAHWEGKLQHPTLHMEEACNKLDEWIQETGLPILTYRGK
jgi:hypothetical protein